MKESVRKQLPETLNEKDYFLQLHETYMSYPQYPAPKEDATYFKFQMYKSYRITHKWRSSTNHPLGCYLGYGRVPAKKTGYKSGSFQLKDSTMEGLFFYRDRQVIMLTAAQLVQYKFGVDPADTLQHRCELFRSDPTGK